MKKLLTALLLISAISTMGQSGLLGSLKKSIGGTSGGSSSLSSTDIVAGLKQALELGAEKSADRAQHPDLLRVRQRLQEVDDGASRFHGNVFARVTVVPPRRAAALPGVLRERFRFEVCFHIRSRC